MLFESLFASAILLGLASFAVYRRGLWAAIYISEHLPRMDELRGAPTRPLDAFEAAALEQVRQAEELVMAEAGETVRMLGPIRNFTDCVNCHGGQRGDLLGAFSYTLRRLEAKDQTTTGRAAPRQDEGSPGVDRPQIPR